MNDIGEALHDGDGFGKEGVDRFGITDAVVLIVEQFVGIDDVVVFGGCLKDHGIAQSVFLQSFKHHIDAYHAGLLLADGIECGCYLTAAVKVGHIDNDNVGTVFEDVTILKDVVIDVGHLEVGYHLGYRIEYRKVERKEGEQTCNGKGQNGDDEVAYHKAWCQF